MQFTTFLLSVIVVCVSHVVCLSQPSARKTVTLQGTVLSEKGEAISGALVYLKGTSKGAHTDTSGYYKIADAEPGSYLLVVEHIGFFRDSAFINLEAGQLQRFNRNMKVDYDHELSTVVVEGKTESHEIKESGFQVSSVEMKKYKNTTADVNLVLNQLPGVRVREQGGLGSSYVLSLNGLSGRQIRFFSDGIPIDYLGSAFRLNNIPVNLVERVDVYKGAVPIELGADALGGAINIITNQEAGCFLDASYSTGSFNTHRTAISARYRSALSGFTTNIRFFYNYSNNNYIMKDMLVFENGKEVKKDLRRFHDTYQSVLGLAEIGFTKTKWADELMLGASLASVQEEIQHGVFAYPVYGDITSKEGNQTYTLRYNKNNFLVKRLNIKLFALYNRVNSTQVDTASKRYDWTGKVTREDNNGTGEISREKTIFEYGQTQFLGRGYASYNLHPNHQLSFNWIGSSIARQGENRLNKKENEPFRSPNNLSKSVLGIAYRSEFFRNKLMTTVSLKNYQFNVLTREAIEYDQGEYKIHDIDTNQQNWGYSLATRYFIFPKLYVKASYEKGYRLPEPIEIFGDGLRTMANPDLLPESSHNVNFGANYRLGIRKSTFVTDVNFFWRDVSNFIQLKDYGMYALHQNVLSVYSNGLEFELNYDYDKRISFNSNFTWQSVLNNEKYLKGTNTTNSVYLDQMPNIPYLFANGDLSGLLFKIKSIQVYGYYAVNYVHSYYLNYASTSKKKTKNSIPSQFLNHAGLTFSTSDKKYNISFEIRNLLDAAAYDNFMLQKPGRAFFIKLRYFIKPVTS